jgi:hypothetical protein
LSAIRSGSVRSWSCSPPAASCFAAPCSRAVQGSSSAFHALTTVTLGALLAAATARPETCWSGTVPASRSESRRAMRSHAQRDRSFHHNLQELWSESRSGTYVARLGDTAGTAAGRPR